MCIDFFLVALHYDVIIVIAAFTATSCIFHYLQVCKSSSVTLLCCITVLAKLMLHHWCCSWLLSLNYFLLNADAASTALAMLAQIALLAAHSAALSCSQLWCRLSSCSCHLPWNVTTCCAVTWFCCQCLSVLLMLFAASAWWWSQHHHNWLIVIFFDVVTITWPVALHLLMPTAIVLDLQIISTIIVYRHILLWLFVCVHLCIIVKENDSSKISSLPKNSSLTTATTSPMIPSVRVTPKNKPINPKPPISANMESIMGMRVQHRVWQANLMAIATCTEGKQSITWWMLPENCLKHSTTLTRAEYC